MLSKNPVILTFLLTKIAWYHRQYSWFHLMNISGPIHKYNTEFDYGMVPNRN